MTRSEYVLSLLRIRPRSVGEVAFQTMQTVKDAQADLELIRDDPEAPVLAIEGSVWRIDPTKVKAPPAPEPKPPVRRRTT